MTIQVKYGSLSDETRTKLGRPDDHGVVWNPERTGKRRGYENGIIYWSEGTGAHVVWTNSPIWEKWEALGWEQPRPESLRYPVSDQRRTSDGSLVQYFQGGLIYWSEATGAIAVRDLPPRPARPVLFKHKISRQGGDQKWFVVDRSIEDLDIVGAKGEATSLYVPDEWTMVVYQKSRFQGDQMTVKGPRIIPKLQKIGWSDTIASVKVSYRNDAARSHYCHDPRYPYGELTLWWAGVINNGEGPTGGAGKHGPGGNLHVLIYDDDQPNPGRQSGESCCAYPKALRQIVLTGPCCGNDAEWDDGLEKSFQDGPLSLFRWRSADDAVNVFVYEADPDRAITDREHDPLFFKRVTRKETLDTTRLVSGMDGCDRFDNPDKNCPSPSADVLNRASDNGVASWLEDETGRTELRLDTPNMFMKLRTAPRASRYFDRMQNDSWNYRQTFLHPRYKGHPLDWCREWAENCGKPAVEKWANQRFFPVNEVVDFQKAEKVPPTKVISSDKLCEDSNCDSFEAVTIGIGR